MNYTLLSMMTAAAAAAAAAAGHKSDGSVNNESAQLMMSVLDRQRTGKDCTSVKNDVDTSWRSHGSATSPTEPTYADIMTSSSRTRRSDDDLPEFPRHQLQVLGLLGKSLRLEAVDFDFR